MRQQFEEKLFAAKNTGGTNTGAMEPRFNALQQDLKNLT
jgi:hypothetical protein